MAKSQPPPDGPAAGDLEDGHLEDGDPVGGGPDARPRADELDFWSFVELAKSELGSQHGDPEQLATDVLLSLNRAANVVTYDLESSVHRPNGLSWSAFRLMFVIWIVGPVEPKHAARLSGMSRAAVSNLTRNLVASQLVERQRMHNDGRSVRLMLTAAGAAKISEIYAEHNEREQAWVGALTRAEKYTLVNLLDKLITAQKPFDVRGRN